MHGILHRIRDGHAEPNRLTNSQSALRVSFVTLSSQETLRVRYVRFFHLPRAVSRDEANSLRDPQLLKSREDTEGNITVENWYSNGCGAEL